MGVELPVGFGQIRVVMSCVGVTRPAVFTMNYDPPTVDPAAHQPQIGLFLLGTGGPLESGQVLEQWTTIDVQCTEMDDTGPITHSGISPIVGTKTGEPVPINAAMILRKHTAAGGRRGRGRCYLPPYFATEDSITPGGMLPTTVSTLENRWENFMEDMATAGFPLVLCHATAPFTPTPITNLTLELLLGTQRRRMRR